MASVGSDGAPQAEAGPQLASTSSRDLDMATKLQDTKSLTIQVLREITDDFSEERKIGQGTYGKVYLAKLENGKDIAVKLLHNNMPGIDDEIFQREFENLMMLDHHNIVRLVGYCYETQHQAMQYKGRTIFAERIYRALCFEYMQNGSLQNHLSGECNGLDWHVRYNIIKGTCEGLKHLHKGFDEPIYHLDLKPDNILLDKNMVPKLADFGLSKIFGDQQTMTTQTPLGTIGYLPMEFLQGNIVSSKFDIFSLGVVMIKIIGGNKAYSDCFEMPQAKFIDLVHENWRNRMKKTCHASRPLEAYCEQVNICMEIALACMEIDRHKRPDITDIIQQLTNTEAVIDKALFWSANSHSRMKGDLVKLRTITGTEGIPDADTSSDFPVLVQVTAPPWLRVEEMPRPSIDIVVVFDIAFCWPDDYRAAMRTVINKLSSNDRLSVVSLKSRPRRLMELTFMTNQGKADALGLLRVREDNFVRHYRSTNVAACLREGAQVLQGREAEEGGSGVGCILFLSDRMSMIPPYKISPEFPVHAFCLGDHSHNAESMKYIADQTSGTYSYFRDVQDVKDGMELFMASIMRVAATSIRITIRAHEGIAISSIESGSYGNNVSSGKISGEIDIRDIYAGEHKNFIVYLTVAEGKKKLVTVGGKYRSLNATSKQLPETDLFVLRPRLGCSPAKLAMHDDVAAELARIRLVKGLSALVERGKRLNIMHMENLWDSVRLPKDGHSPPKETLSRLRRYVNEMKKLACCYDAYSPKQVPYLMSWLSCHQWQRATTKGECYDSGAFTLARAAWRCR
uniref:Uncharacterized protein n=1 Tax=Avena sativa TaxID=4498 RepID=A0ACD5TBE7_AVESA